MTTKYMVAVALITPFLTVSSLAQQYEGGPKSSVPPTTSQISSGGDIYAQGVDVYAPAVYAPAVRANKSHAYHGGRKAAAE